MDSSTHRKDIAWAKSNYLSRYFLSTATRRYFPFCIYLSNKCNGVLDQNLDLNVSHCRSNNEVLHKLDRQLVPSSTFNLYNLPLGYLILVTFWVVFKNALRNKIYLESVYSP